MTSARLKGTPAANKLESSRVKVSNMRGVMRLDLNLKLSPPTGAAPAPFFAAPAAADFSAKLMGRNPFSSIRRKALSNT